METLWPWFPVQVILPNLKDFWTDVVLMANFTDTEAPGAMVKVVGVAVKLVPDGTEMVVV